MKLSLVLRYIVLFCASGLVDASGNQHALHYRFVPDQAHSGFTSGLRNNLLIGGATGLSCYAAYRLGSGSLSSEHHRRIALGISSSILISAAAMTTFAHAQLRSIDQRRYDLHHNPDSIKQMDQALERIVTRRIDPLTREMYTAGKDHRKAIQETQRRILAIKQSQENYQSALALIAELEKNMATEQEKHNKLRKGIITEVDLKQAEQYFDMRVQGAWQNFSEQFLFPKPRLPIQSLKYFLPHDIRPHCPHAHTITTLSAPFDAIAETICLTAARNLLVPITASDFAHNKMRYAISAETESALKQISDTEGQIRDNLCIAYGVRAYHYKDGVLPESHILELEAEIEKCKTALADIQAHYTKPLERAVTVSAQDRMSVADNLRPDCTGANKSWYQGFYTGALISLTTVATGLCHYLLS